MLFFKMSWNRQFTLASWTFSWNSHIAVLVHKYIASGKRIIFTEFLSFQI
jgi:hypothetical protein